ncbi:MAG TPA: Clp protease N-terminal domain-containing protein [Ktedonobacterales bacterium]
MSSARSGSSESLLPDPGLFARFTEEARGVLAAAQRAAQRFRSADIRSEHLLFALVSAQQTIAARALASLGLDRAQFLFEQALQWNQPWWSEGGTTRPKGKAPQLTAETKAIIERAVAEVRTRQQCEIGPEHLLLGVLDEPDCAASQFLVLRGFLIERIRAQVDELMVQPPRPAAATGGAKSNVVTCRLDDATLDAVDSLVEAGIRSSRSDAVAWLIGAGIEAHRALFEGVQATVTAIRELRAEAAHIARSPAASHVAPPAASVPAEEEQT